MRFLRKSIIRKLFLNLFLFTLLIGAIVYYFYLSEIGQVPFEYLVIALGVFLLYFLIAYWVDVVRPLKKILVPIQALMAGQEYKRIYTNRIDEIGVLAHFFNRVTSTLGEASSSIKDRARMIDELQIAAQLQKDILPTKTPPVPQMEVVAKNKPASELGGDSFDVFTVKGKTFIYIGDVTGHGVAAGLIMTMVNSLISVFADMYVAPYEVMVNVNKYVKRHVKQSMFMTMVMLCWDPEADRLSYVGAGHEHILVYRGDSGECEALLSGGVALGMVPDNSAMIAEKEIQLNEGDFIVLYSDGITEARNEAGELYGLERLQTSVKEFASQYSADGVHYHLAKTVSDFMGNAKQLDDMTLIVLKKNAQSSEKSYSEADTSW